MALEGYQTSIVAGKLYEVAALRRYQTVAQLTPNIWINGGTASVYGSNSATVPTALSDMSLPNSNVDLEDMHVFEVVPRYIAVTGTATELVITGLDVREIGSIS